MVGVRGLFINEIAFVVSGFYSFLLIQTLYFVVWNVCIYFFDFYILKIVVGRISGIRAYLFW